MNTFINKEAFLKVFSRYFSFIILTVFLACNQSEQYPLKDYYFPVETLKEGLVYEYRAAENNSLSPEYWYYCTFQTDSSLFFTGQYYNASFEVGQFFREKVVTSGTLMKSYILYLPDTSNQKTRVDINIIEPNVFSFEQTDTNTILLFKTEFSDPAVPGRTATLIRNRRFKGFKDFTLNNKKINCAVFNIKEIISTNEEGVQELTINGQEYYGKNMGLVYFEKKQEDVLLMSYKLHDRYTMEELEKKFSDKMKPNSDKE